MRKDLRENDIKSSIEKRTRSRSANLGLLGKTHQRVQLVEEQHNVDRLENVLCGERNGF